MKGQKSLISQTPEKATKEKSKTAKESEVGLAAPATEETAEQRAVKKASAVKPAAKKTAAPKSAATDTAAEPVTEAPVVTQEKARKTSAKTDKDKLVAQTDKPVIQKPKKKVLYVTSEAQPFAATGGLGDVAGSLPISITKASDEYDVRVIMPLYTSVMSDEYKRNLKFLSSCSVVLAWRNQYCGVFEYDYRGIKYYFIDNEYYFKRPNLYGFYDDGERFAFFSKAVLSVLNIIEFYPDLIECSDWQTALIPVYYKLFFQYQPRCENIKTLFTIHNIEYQGKFPRECCEDLLGIPFREYLSLEHDGVINLMKAAIDYSDAVSTVSPTYAKEIVSDYFAHGLAGILNRNKHKLTGILNGIDTEFYNPETDKALFYTYNYKNAVEKKRQNKAELQKMLNLNEDENIPVIGVISRLVPHKGIDLLKFACNELLTSDVQLIVLGKGNADFEAYFSHMQNLHRGKVSAIIAYNADLSRKIYAASDIFLMPSKSEPCGLSQMIASRYGAVPVVRETGGLYDSIKDAYDGTNGNGYTFSSYNAQDMLNAINRATGLYRDYKVKFNDLVKKVMTTDFSWSSSAKEYIKLFDTIIG